MLIILVAFYEFQGHHVVNLERKILNQDQLKINLNLPNGAFSSNTKHLEFLG